MESLHKKTPFLETITRYIKPEMRILISGHKLTDMPFSMFLDSNFTGIVTTINNKEAYFTESIVDPGWQIQCLEKSRFVHSDLELSDFILVSNDDQNKMDVYIAEFESGLKPGGFMFISCLQSEYTQVRRKITNKNFELIEVYNDTVECYFLIKKGWDITYTQSDLLPLSYHY